MPRHITDEDEWDDDDEDEEPTIPCPYCKRQIHEDSQRCPHCEQYISEEDTPPSRKRWWIIIGVLICLYLIYLWIAG
jgi:predicted nucleic acid-binding Zn ribbon protein